MYEIFKDFLNRIDECAEVLRCSMGETYANVDFKHNGETYLLTIMKEEKKDDSV